MKNIKKKKYIIRVDMRKLKTTRKKNTKREIKGCHKGRNRRNIHRSKASNQEEV